MTQEYHDKMGPPTDGKLNPAGNWFQDHGEMINFADHLLDIGEFHDPGSVIAFFEKPWKWAEEYVEWREQLEQEGDA